MTRPNKTTLYLLAGFAALLLIILFFSMRDAGNQDRLGDAAAPTLRDSETSVEDCSGNLVNAGLKRALFDRSAESRPADAEAFRQIAATAVLRMENPAIENEVDDRLDCSASVAIDLPPGIVTSGGRRNLMGDVDYSVWRRTGDIALRSGSGIATALSGMQRSSREVSAPFGMVPVEDPLAGAMPPAAPVVPDPRPAVEPSARQPTIPPPRAPLAPAGNCARARSKAEQMMCADPRLGAFGVEMASRYQRAMGRASPAQRDILRDSEFRFLFYRDRCRDADCVIRAYQGRFAEIADIMSGNWRPPN